jgi:hypothetical protein
LFNGSLLKLSGTSAAITQIPHHLSFYYPDATPELKLFPTLNPGTSLALASKKLKDVEATAERLRLELQQIQRGL